MKSPNLIVYEMLNDSIQAIGVIEEYISVSYSPRFNEVGSFILVVPFTTQNFNLLSRQNDCEKLVLFEDSILGICHKINISNTPEKRQIKVQGMLAEGLLENNAAASFSVDQEQATRAKNIQTRMEVFVRGHQIPTDTGSWWPGMRFVTIEPNDSRFVISDGYQTKAGTTRDLVETLAKACDKGYSVKLSTDSGTDFLNLQFELYTDRTINQTENDPVVISVEFGDLYSSEFTINSNNWKNAVYAYGKYTTSEGRTEIAKKIITYDVPGSIENIPSKALRATFVEVEITPEDASSPMTQSEAEAVLYRQGKLKLYEFALVKAYNCKLRESNGTFKFNQDYFLGDKITIFDKDLGLQLDAQLLEYTKTYDEKGVHFEPVFGFSQPTLNRILKQKGVI